MSQCYYVVILVGHLKYRNSHGIDFSDLEKLVVLVTAGDGWGTGVLLSPSFVLTCNHVIEKRKGANITMYTVGLDKNALLYFFSAFLCNLLGYNSFVAMYTNLFCTQI